MASFDWYSIITASDNKTKVTRRSPVNRDWTDNLQANPDLTKGLYHNTYPGMKLGGALAYNPIAVPLNFMGSPIPTTGEEGTPGEEALDEIVELMASVFKNIHRQCHREGTIWIWPIMTNGTLLWEFIPDTIITDIVRDVNTGEVIRLEANENLRLSIGDGKETTVRRARTFTAQRVTVSYDGIVPSSLRQGDFRNPAGLIPIPFSNNADGDEIRGHSDYERILSDLKNYHDIDLAESTILAKFTPKMIANNLKDVNAFAVNNGYENSANMISTIEIATIDLLLAGDGEEIKFEFPERVTESYRDKLKGIFKKIVEGSGIPEIAWGLKTSGNMASVEENMAALMNYVSDKREQKQDAYVALFEASLRLYVAAGLLASAPPVIVEWNRLEALNDKTKSEIFKNFADGISMLVGKAAITKDQLFKLWQQNFPQATGEEFDEFVVELAAMTGHTVATNSTLSEYLPAVGLLSDDTSGV